MKQRRIRTRGKINLTLDVLGKREDGYHEVEMIMQSINLSDEMVFRITKRGIVLHCNSNKIPCNRRNIVYKTAKLLQEQYNVDKGIEIDLYKNIPVSAGLAGGSSNAAGTLKVLNELWDLNLPMETLMELGKSIGADVPFCLLGGTALAKGIGEVLTPLSPMPTTWLVLVKPNISVSTPWVYRNLTLNDKTKHPETQKVIEGIKNKDVQKMYPYLYNVLEDVTTAAHPQIKSIKNRLKTLGAQGVMMSGSGPTVFGLCKDEGQAKEIYNEMKEEYKEVYVTRTYNREK